MNIRLAGVLASAGVAALCGRPASAQSGCDGRFVDGIGVPGAPIGTDVRSVVEWDPDGPGPAKPLVVAVMDKYSMAGYSFGASVFAYDGSAWRPLGLKGGFSNVNQLAVFRGELYAAGGFTSGERAGVVLNGLARWDGAVWQPVPRNPATKGIQSLFVYKDRLVIASVGANSLTVAGQNVGGAAAFDGFTWHGLGSAPTYIQCFSAFNGDLIAGGDFVSSNGTSDLNHVARWDGASWQALGGPTPGVNGIVRALAAFDGSLFAGGEFTSAGGVSAINIARWNGSEWHDVAGVNPNGSVTALLPCRGMLYAGGSFNSFGATTINKLGTWDGSEWRSAVSGQVDALTAGTSSSEAVKSLAVVGNRLFASGSFRGVDYPGFGGGLGGIAAVPSDPNERYSRLSSFEGMYLAGFVHFKGDLYGYGILGYDPNNEYQPSIAKFTNGIWTRVGGSLTPAYSNDTLIGRLRDACIFQDSLVFVGLFKGVDGAIARNVAAFDGAAWSSVVPDDVWPPSGSLYSVAPLDGALILGGEFTNATTVEGTATNIARWDGTQLHSMGTIPKRVDVIRALDGSLYAGTTGDAYKWNGTEWVAMRSASNVGITNVNDFIVFKGMLIAEAFGRAYRWDGAAWTSIDPVGASTQLGRLIEYSGRLVRLGQSSSQLVRNVRDWSGTGNWRSLGITSDYNQIISPINNTSLTCAIVHDNELLLGGYVGDFSPGNLNFGSPKGIIVSRFVGDTLPRFEGEPVGRAFTVGTEARMQASLGAGAERPSVVSFQWRRDGAPIVNGVGGASSGGGTVQGATSATLHIFGVQPSDAGAYDVVATSACGTQLSDSGMLKVRMIAPDINADGLVDDADFALFVVQYDTMICNDPAMPDGCSADFNGDGIVDDQDFVLFVPAYNVMLATGA